MSNIPSLFSRLRYYFDQTIASGTGFLLLWIAAISLIIIAIGAVLLSIGAVPTGEEPKKFGEAFWSALNMALDPRAVENPGWSYRAVMLSVAILGILIVSTLIGILTSGIGEKLDELRRGLSQIFEKNHTLILGWSEKIGPIIRELIIANENMRDAVVVVLADRDKVEMEEKLTAVIGDPKSTRLICRRGKPSDLSNLNMVSPHTARSFIILREEFADSDDDVIKAILALRQICGSPLTSPIVAEIVESANADAASRIEPKVSVINANELVLRIIAQAAREPGLSRVYEEILSFAGAEIYSQREPRVEGMSFAKASEHYESSILIGLLDPSGRAVLNPPSEQLIKKGESLIAIAEDDDQIIYSATEQKPPDLKRLDTLDYVTRQPEKPPEKILILGWHLQAKLLLKELDELLPTGSEVLLTYNSELVTEVPKIDIKKTSIKCTLREGDTTDRRLLEEIDPMKFDRVIVLSYRDQIHIQKADSKTLLTLIHLRDMRRGTRDFTITSEIIDTRNRALVEEKDDTSDFVASEELVSRALVQISEDFVRKVLLEELLTARGCEFHIRSIEAFNTISPVTFFDISWTAMMQGEIAVGYRNNGKIVFNPIKSELIKFSDDGAVIVLAED